MVESKKDLCIAVTRLLNQLMILKDECYYHFYVNMFNPMLDQVIDDVNRWFTAGPPGIPV